MKFVHGLMLGLAATVGLSLTAGVAGAAEKKPQKILFFTRSAGFEHEAIRHTDGKLGYGERAMQEMAKELGVDIEITKDGAVFDGDLSPYDVIMFYTSGDLSTLGHKIPPKFSKDDPGQPVSAKGKQNLLEAIKNGKSFYGIHPTTDSYHNAEAIDPFLTMVGAEFVKHDMQQVATASVAAPDFPGVQGKKGLTMMEEWYTMYRFAPDLHVILVQETAGMEGPHYQRPPFPATWAHLYGKGRVFYTSFGHREDVWNNPDVRELMKGGLLWTLHRVDADVTPNIDKVTPGANDVPKAQLK